jgi:hypothetical protein
MAGGYAGAEEGGRVRRRDLEGVDIEVVEAQQCDGVLQRRSTVSMRVRTPRRCWLTGTCVPNALARSSTATPVLRGLVLMLTWTSKPITKARTKSAAFCSDATSSVCSDVCRSSANNSMPTKLFLLHIGIFTA